MEAGHSLTDTQVSCQPFEVIDALHGGLLASAKQADLLSFGGAGEQAIEQAGDRQQQRYPTLTLRPTAP